ncbi:hypothetical protein ACFLSX_02940 [Calditrichota bacterium]
MSLMRARAYGIGSSNRPRVHQSLKQAAAPFDGSDAECSQSAQGRPVWPPGRLQEFSLLIAGVRFCKTSETIRIDHFTHILPYSTYNCVKNSCHLVLSKSVLSNLFYTLVYRE